MPPEVNPESHPQRAHSPVPGVVRSASWVPLVSAAVAAFLLTATGFGFAYLFDDYIFLTTALSPRPISLLPDPGSMLYRPISREVYFELLNQISPGSPIVGHLINAGLLVGIVVLGATLVSRLSGRRAGIIAGILLATLSPWPVLVAWVSGSQDLLGILFVLTALVLEHRRRGMAALFAFAAAVLSKETAVVMAPALVMARWLGSRSGAETRVAIARYGLLVIAWGLLHPGIRVLLSLGGASPPGGYIGFDNPDRLLYLLRSLPVLLNLPLTGYPTPWPGEHVWVLGLAAVPLGLALWALTRTGQEAAAPSASARGRGSAAQVSLFGGILAVPPLLLTSLLVHHWVPYYECFPAVGVIIAAAPWLERLPNRIVVGALVVYIVGGFWSRGIELQPGLPTERGLAPAGKGLMRLERNFKRVAPTLPSGCVVYVTTLATGAQSVYIHLHEFQVLRVWYQDPEIQTLRPELRVISSSPEMLFGVEPGLDVDQINPDNLTVRTSDGPEARRYSRNILTSYAIGLAQTDDTQRAVEILSRLSAPNSWDHVADLRIAATLLISRGRRAAATDLVRGLPQFQPDVAVEHVGLLLTIPTRGVHLEDAAIEAFGLPANDPRVYRALLGGSTALGYDAVAARMATRLLALVPGDREAREALAKPESRRRKTGVRIMPPIKTLRFPWE